MLPITLVLRWMKCPWAPCESMRCSTLASIFVEMFFPYTLYCSHVIHSNNWGQEHLTMPLKRTGCQHHMGIPLLAAYTQMGLLPCRLYLATCHHVRMWRAPKSLLLSVDYLEPLGDTLFLSPTGQCGFPRGKPVPFNYGCFPQTYRDPEKAAEWKDRSGWQAIQRDPTFDLFGRPMSFTLLRVMMIPWMCWAAQSQPFAEMEMDRVLAIQDWFGWCTNRGWKSSLNFVAGNPVVDMTPGGDHCTVPCLRCCLSYWWRPGANFRGGCIGCRMKVYRPVNGWKRWQKFKCFMQFEWIRDDVMILLVCGAHSASGCFG